jgi:hypothetical protein
MSPLKRCPQWGTFEIGFSMRPTLVVAIAALLSLGNGVAEGADTAQLAETAGFLLGNAHRRGVATDRVEHAGKVIHGVCREHTDCEGGVELQER